jgi:hypothetical protein
LPAEISPYLIFATPLIFCWLWKARIRHLSENNGSSGHDLSIRLEMSFFNELMPASLAGVTAINSWLNKAELENLWAD